MAVSLAESANNAQNDYDPAVIDEFRKESVIADSLIFDDVVNPSGGGNTLTYGYRRLATQPVADTREINTEYTPANVTTTKVSVDLAVMGGSFEVDRVIAKVGPAASAAVSLNLSQKIKATTTKFQDQVINGDTAVDENGFDGLDKALTGSSTEYNTGAVADWHDLDTAAATKFTALDALDEFLSLLDGTPTVLVGNQSALARVRAIVRRSGMYTRDPIEGLIGQNGRPINRESYGGITFADAGNKAGSNDPIIPLATRSLKWTVTVAATGGTYTITVNGRTTAPIAYGANDAAIKAAIDALGNVAPVTVSSKAITFTSYANVTVDGAAATGGAVTVATTGTDTADNLTDIYAYRVGLDGFHGVSTVGGVLVQTWLPDFTTSGAVKKGEVELGPIAVALKATKAAAVFRNIRVK